MGRGFCEDSGMAGCYQSGRELYWKKFPKTGNKIIDKMKSRMSDIPIVPNIFCCFLLALEVLA